MKKLKLDLTNQGSPEALSKNQLKNVLGSEPLSGTGGEEDSGDEDGFEEEGAENEDDGFDEDSSDDDGSTEDGDDDSTDDSSDDGTDDGDDDDDDDDDDCSDEAQSRGSDATGLYNNTSVKNQINGGGLFPSGNTNEHGFLINADGTTITAGSIQDMGSSNNGTLKGASSSTIGFLHTHPNDNYPPSVTDILTLAGAGTNGLVNIDTSYVITQNGTSYALVITDSTKAADFYNNFKNDIAPDGYWEAGSTPSDNYNAAYNSFIAQGYADTEAVTRAQAYVLQDSGIMLFQAPSGSTTLSKIGTVKDGTTFDTSDCPRD
jgi:hypothetical protein